jgi:hypothetical protein
LFDNSKGTATIMVGVTAIVTMDSNGDFTDVATAGAAPTATDGSLRALKMRFSGFSSAEKGRLNGPDGNQMDTESFLASLKIITSAAILDQDGNTVLAAATEVPFRLVTQKYGKGIVTYDNICDSLGDVYVELDLTHPVSAVGTSTDDGYVGGAASSVSALTSANFAVTWAE